MDYIYIMFIKQKISVCRYACLFVCVCVGLLQLLPGLYHLLATNTVWPLTWCLYPQRNLFVHRNSYLHMHVFDGIIHSCKYETHTHHIYNYIWSYSVAGKYILLIGSFDDIIIYIYIQGCGNSEPIAGHFGLFSLLLSCSPYTLYTV